MRSVGGARCKERRMSDLNWYEDKIYTALARAEIPGEVAAAIARLVCNASVRAPDQSEALGDFAVDG